MADRLREIAPRSQCDDLPLRRARSRPSLLEGWSRYAKYAVEFRVDFKVDTDNRANGHHCR